MLGTSKYRFCLARDPNTIEEMTLTVESTWSVIQHGIKSSFKEQLSGTIRYLTVVNTDSGEVIGDKILDAGIFWLAIVKWYKADSTIFRVYDNSLVDFQVQLQSTQTPPVTLCASYLCGFEDILAEVYKNYSYLSPGAITHLCAVKEGRILNKTIFNEESFWAAFTNESAERRTAHFILAAASLEKLEIAASTFPDKFSIYVPKNCSLELLNTIIVDGILKLKGSRVQVFDIVVRSLRGTEKLSSSYQLSTLFNVATSWLYVTLQSPATNAEAVSKVEGKSGSETSPAGPAFLLRFCLSGEKEKYCTLLIPKGESIDNIKEMVVTKCNHLTATEIKHFILLDRDGDDFSSGLDTESKFWRIASKYFKDPASTEYTFNIILRRAKRSGEKPTIVCDPVEVKEVQAPPAAPVAVATAVGAPPHPPTAVSDNALSHGTQTTNSVAVLEVSAVPSKSVGEVNSNASLPTTNPKAEVAKGTGTLSSSSTSRNTMVTSTSSEALSEKATTSPSTKNNTSILEKKSPEPVVNSGATKDTDMKTGKDTTATSSSTTCVLNVKLSNKAQMLVMPSRRLELLRKKDSKSNAAGNGDSYTISVPYGCSWDDVLLAICKATGLTSAGDISHLIPIITNESGRPMSKKKDAALIVDRFQFWATEKRATEGNDIVTWEVHASSKGVPDSAISKVSSAGI